MKKGIFIIIAVLIVGAAFYWYSTASASVGNLNIYSGSVTVERSKKEVAGNTGFGIKPTDIVKVSGGSRVAIVLKDGSVVRLEAGTVMEIVGEGEYKLISGKMWSKVEPLAAGAKWEVETPTIVAAVRGTQFNTRYSDASSGVSVYKGTVGVGLLENRAVEKALEKGNQFILGDNTLQEDFAKDPIVMDPSMYDEWIVFNLGEDAKLDGESLVVPQEEVVNNTTPSPEPVAPAPVPVQPGKKLLAVSISGYKSILLVNEETKIRATAKYSDNTNYEIPFEQITWIRNTSPKTSSLTSPGYFSSSKVGTFTFQAQFDGVTSGPVTITVKDTLRVLKRIELTYTKNSNQEQTYYEYPTVQFSANAFYDDGSTNDITDKVTWSVESGTAGGSISISGLYTAATRGDAVIKAAYEGKSTTQPISIP